MIIFHWHIAKPAAVFALMLISIAIYADPAAIPGCSLELRADSLLPVRLYETGTGYADLIDIETDYKQSGNHKKALIRLLKVMRVKKIFQSSRTSARLFSDLATISARLRLYPQAMQYYNQTILADNRNTPSIQQQGEPDRNNGFYRTAVFTGSDTASIPDALDHNIDSEPVDITSVIESFDDKKPVSEYALILQVKQPLPGKRKAFKGITNVGHMFITLIKYNTDHSYVSRSFGFYPDKNSNIAATPLHPGSTSTFKDDARHDWDELIGKFISQKRFYRILRLLDRYQKKTYNLNANNCTDFGLTVAEIGGISIFDTRGKWPLGRGNTPANAGQSILQEKILNTDLGTKENLFICFENSVSK